MKCQPTAAQMPRTFYDANMNNGKLVVMESNFAEEETDNDNGGNDNDISRDLQQ